MNKEIKERWVQALRSGDFEQGQHRLQQMGKFCCLGVLCELAMQDGVEMKMEINPYSGIGHYGGCNSYLPVEVSKWAGPVEIDVIGLNDSGCSFEYIADQIEAFTPHVG